MTRGKTSLHMFALTTALKFKIGLMLNASCSTQMYFEIAAKQNAINKMLYSKVLSQCTPTLVVRKMTGARHDLCQHLHLLPLLGVDYIDKHKQ